MTIAARNRIMIGGAGVVLLFAAVFVAATALLFRTIPVPSLDFDSQSSIASLALLILCELIFCAGAVVVLYFSFRKTASAEIFLFLLFIVSMSFDALKALHILFNAADVAPYYGTLVTRTILFGRFLGALSLFACGLFTTGLQYERLEAALAAVLLLSFAVASTVPIDMTTLEDHFVMSTLYDQEINIITIILYALALINFGFAAAMTANKNYLLICAGLAMVIVGRELLYYRTDGLSIIVAFVLLIPGSTLFGERMHEIYLWA